MTGNLKELIYGNTSMVVWGAFIFFTILMQILHWLKVNVFKIIVMLGTFALALAFAGNDLVNFIGVPLVGYSSYMDLMAQGGTTTTDTFLLGSLLAPAQTPWYFLVGSGLVMVIALATSKKAHNVVKTSLDLSRQSEGNESFGTSPVARMLVRTCNNASSTILSVVPPKVKDWIDSRFNNDEIILEDKASFRRLTWHLWWQWAVRWPTVPGDGKVRFTVLPVCCRLSADGLLRRELLLRFASWLLSLFILEALQRWRRWSAWQFIC